jgi:hypothetical protein
MRKQRQSGWGFLNLNIFECVSVTRCKRFSRHSKLSKTNILESIVDQKVAVNRTICLFNLSHAVCPSVRIDCSTLAASIDQLYQPSRRTTQKPHFFPQQRIINIVQHH